jgi:tRNA nucleotidyltransferase/poly(A) polymerase
VNEPKQQSGKQQAELLSQARDAAIDILRTLQEAGHIAYLAGGCVRDRLLGKLPKDFDIATNAEPKQVRKLFRKTLFVGQAFGVVLVRHKDVPVEVATFRTEWGYEDGRHPDHVEFSDAEHDAQRRDFTVNGLFENPLAEAQSEKIIDFVGGQADLQDKVIRAIGDPGQRFSEDYLRLLRGPRFAANLDFQIEPATAQAIRDHASKLGQISRERIGQEMRKMFGGPNFVRAVSLLQSSHVVGPILDEEHRETPLPSLELLDGKGDFVLTAAAWMLDHYVFDRLPDKDSADPSENAAAECRQAIERFVLRDMGARLGQWRRAMCLSNEECLSIGDALRVAQEATHWADLGIAKRKRLLARSSWNRAMELLRACGHVPGISGWVARIKLEAAPLVDQGVDPDPLVTGHDLISLGLDPGPDFAKLLERIFDAQLEKRVESKVQAMALLGQWLVK